MWGRLGVSGFRCCQTFEPSKGGWSFLGGASDKSAGGTCRTFRNRWSDRGTAPARSGEEEKMSDQVHRIIELLLPPADGVFEGEAAILPRSSTLPLSACPPISRLQEGAQLKPERATKIRQLKDFRLRFTETGTSLRASSASWSPALASRTAEGCRERPRTQTLPTSNPKP